MPRLADALVRYRWMVLAAAAVAIVVAGAVGGGVASSLSNGGFEDPDAEAVLAADVLEEQFAAKQPSLVLIVGRPGTSVDDPAVATAAAGLVSELAAETGVDGVESYWSLGSPSSLRSFDGSRALVFATLSGDEGAQLDTAGRLADRYRGTRDGLDVLVGGPGPLSAELDETIESDLTRAEAIAFPITLVLMILIFGSVVAALLPLGIGVFSIVGTFFVLQILTGFTEVSIFALNLTTALGLGLAIDYSLFVVSRFREELAAGWEPADAVRRTVRTAGRTVLFSAGTVAVSLAALLVFPLAFLRSFAYAGIAVVGLAAVGAVLVLPALLAVLGRRVDRLRVRRVRPVTAGSGMWHRIATTVMRRPLPIATATMALLVVLGLPFLSVQLGESDDRVLAVGTDARTAGDVLRSEFDGFEASPVSVVVTPVDPTGVDAYAATISGLPGVTRVDGPTGSFIGGTRVIPAGPASARFRSADGVYLSVVPAVEPTSPQASALVAQIRGIDAPGEVLVGGAAAELVDAKASLFGALPWALGMIATVTFVVLFLMFGSVLVPVKALVLNMLSLSATFGALVWVFQQGHLADLLGFTATGTLDLTIPILMFAIAFGLSMDYEVFLLSRIKEEHDRGSDTVSSVAVGLERTGRIVTAAAVLIAVVFLAFATSRVSFIKMLGVGMTLAVLVDAFVVRATLVPAFMRLAGNANWWAPRPLRRIHDRYGLSDSVELPPKLEHQVSEA